MSAFLTCISRDQPRNPDGRPTCAVVLTFTFSMNYRNMQLEEDSIWASNTLLGRDH